MDDEVSSAAKDELNSSVVEVSDSSSCSEDCEIVSVESGEGSWRDTSAPTRRLKKLFESGYRNTRRLIHVLFGINEELLPNEPMRLLQILYSLLSEPAPRQRLSTVNSLTKAVSCIHKAERIMVLTGAGISVSCGIPDFRSWNGIYSRLARDFPKLKSPQSMFDIQYFITDPQPFFQFAKEIYPGQFSPSVTHRFIALLDNKQKLLRNYTQNIDTLEQEAKIERVIQCHGSFSEATCITCHKKYSQDEIRKDIFNQVIPKCCACVSSSVPVEVNEEQEIDDPYILYKLHDHSVRDPASPAFGVIKPDIVFFGENLPDAFHNALAMDIKETDLLIVIGSSLKVRPVGSIPHAVPPQVPRILINREPLTNHEFDLELYGNCDTIVAELLHRLSWSLPTLETTHGKKLPPFEPESLSQVDIAEAQEAFLKQRKEKEQKKLESLANAAREPQVTETAVPSTSQNETSGDLSPKAQEESSDDEDDGEVTWPVGKYLSPGTFCRVASHEYAFPGCEFETYILGEEELEWMRSLRAEEHNPASIEDEPPSPVEEEDAEELYMSSLLLKCASDPVLGRHASSNVADLLQQSAPDESDSESDSVKNIADVSVEVEQDQPQPVPSSKRTRIVEATDECEPAEKRN